MNEALINRERRYSQEEIAQRGNALYEQRIRAKVEPDKQGSIVAIDIDSGAFAIADNTVAASQELLVDYPAAQIWFVRVGYSSVHRFGPQFRSRQK